MFAHQCRRGRRRALTVVTSFVLLLARARADGPLGPSSDERWDEAVDADISYDVRISDPTWVVPSGALPAGINVQDSNNNLSIAFHAGRLFLAWRTAPTHFASVQARLYVMSSADLGRSWTRETEIALGRDLREPFLLEVGGRLRLYFAELGGNAWAFEPRALWRCERVGGRWTQPERWKEAREIAWDFKVRRGRAWMTSYVGKGYEVRGGPVQLHFRSSVDGLGWADVEQDPVYQGGVTEAAFEFEPGGRLWAVTRDEDGDATGFGSHVVTAEADRPGRWQFPLRADPNRYDSPRMFRHGADLYVVARRDLAATPIGERMSIMPTSLRKLFLWPAYSLRPKRTALYRLDKRTRSLVPLVDLPSAGDTAFPSIARLGPDTYLIANYTSPLESGGASWLRGQLGRTGIYLVTLRFVPRPGDDPVRRASAR